MHKQTRHFQAAVAATALALTMAACGGSEDTAASGGGGGGGDEPYIAIVSKGFQHQFWQAVKEGAEQQAEKDGVRVSFEGPSTETEVEAQVTMLTNALTKQPDAIGFAALDSKAAAPLMEQAKAADIPVVAFDSGVESDVPVTTAATDNKAAAAEAASGSRSQIAWNSARCSTRVCSHRPGAVRVVSG